MKKVLFILIAFFGISSLGKAQMQFGVKSSVGVSLAQDEATYSGEVFDYINHEVKYTGSNLVKSYGLFAQEKFGYLYFRGEAAFTHFTQDYTVRSFVQLGQEPREVKENFNFLDFQLMGGLTHKNLRLGVGPVAHVLVGHNNDLDFISGYNENLRGITYGFTTAIGLDAGRFHFDLRYENNFRTVGDHINYGSRNARFTQKPNVLNFTVGITI